MEELLSKEIVLSLIDAIKSVLLVSAGGFITIYFQNKQERWRICRSENKAYRDRIYQFKTDLSAQVEKFIMLGACDTEDIKKYADVYHFNKSLANGVRTLCGVLDHFLFLKDLERVPSPDYDPSEIKPDPKLISEVEVLSRSLLNLLDKHLDLKDGRL